MEEDKKDWRVFAVKITIVILIIVLSTIVIIDYMDVDTQQSQEHLHLKGTVKYIRYGCLGGRRVSSNQMRMGYLIYAVGLQLEGENITHRYHMFFGFDDYESVGDIWNNGTWRYKDSKKLPECNVTYDFYYNWNTNFHEANTGDKESVMNIYRFE